MLTKIKEEYISYRSKAEHINNYFRRDMPQQVFDYLEERGICECSRSKFGLGFGWDTKDVYDILLGGSVDGFSVNEKDLIDLGLLVPRKDSEGYSYLMSNRLIFPLKDIKGSICGWTGRRMNDDKSSPKYINTASTNFFQKFLFIFGINEAYESIKNTGVALVVEGVLDVITCHFYGITNAVAPCGTSLTKEHLLMLKCICSEVCLCFDNDEAGKKAQDRSMKICDDIGLKHFELEISGAKDLDEYLKKFGAEELSACIIRS